MGTKAQEWAQKRNYGKSRLMGMQTTLANMKHQDWLTHKEALMLEGIEERLSRVIDHWKGNNKFSKEYYLEVSK